MSDEKQKAVVTYDAAVLSAAEIVAPMISKDEPDLEARALRAGMQSAVTKDAILEVTAGRTDLNPSEAGIVLRAVASIIKERRRNMAMAQTKDAVQTPARKSLNDITADDINAMNAKFYGKGV